MIVIKLHCFWPTYLS